MEITTDILSPAFARIGFFVYGSALLYTIWRMPWYWLRRDGVLNRFVGACVATLAIWQLRAEIDGGPTVHLLGATLLTLAFGWRLAVLALSVVLIASTAVSSSGWAAIGANGSVIVLLGVGISYGVARASERYFPEHLFVYLFIAAFFGAAIATAAVAVAAVAVILFSGVMHAPEINRNYLPTSLLLLFPEAFTTGALVTLAAVYRPQWLVSYTDQRYLARHNEGGRDGS